MEDISEKKNLLSFKCWKNYHKEGTKIKDGKKVNNCVANENVEEIFDMIESTVEQYATDNGFTSDYLWDLFGAISDDELLEATILILIANEFTLFSFLIMCGIKSLYS